MLGYRYCDLKLRDYFTSKNSRPFLKRRWYVCTIWNIAAIKVDHCHWLLGSRFWVFRILPTLCGPVEFSVCVPETIYCVISDWTLWWLQREICFLDFPRSRLLNANDKYKAHTWKQTLVVSTSRKKSSQNNINNPLPPNVRHASPTLTHFCAFCENRTI